MLGGGFFVVDKNSHWTTPVKIKSKKVCLSSKITKNEFYQQRSVGDCYFLAALDALIHSDKSHGLLNRIGVIKDYYSNGEKYYQVHFPTGKKSEVSSLELGQAKKKLQPVSGSKYVQLLELAYLRIIQKLRSGNPKAPLPNNVQDNVFEVGRGGFSNDALKEMVGDTSDASMNLSENSSNSFEVSLSTKEAVIDFLHTVKKDLVHTYLLTASTPAQSKTKNEIVIEHNDQKINFPLQHAYAIRAFNLRKNEITIANPHDSALKVYKLPINIFCKVFKRLNYFKMPNSDINW